jgi:Cof subfamily protein (haloacid dehalogenase superfamily)
MINREKLQRIKLVVFDLDGTLLNSEGKIGEESIELIKQLRESGVRFSFATGRLHSACTDYAAQLSIDVPFISLDGSLIKSYPDDKILFQSSIPARYIKKAIGLSDHLLLKIALCHADAIYYTDSNSLIPELLDKYGRYEQVDSYENYLSNTLEMVVAGDFKQSIKAFANRMTFPYTFGLNTSYYRSQSRGDLYYFEARKTGSDKGTALKKLARFLGINIKETAVLGDWYNDRELFRAGGLKIAVANAVPEIKYNSDYVTKRTNDEDGTAEFLNMLMEVRNQK